MATETSERTLVIDNEEILTRTPVVKLKGES